MLLKMGFSTEVQKRQRKEAELEDLAKEFAVHKVTASGISYIVSSRTCVRRVLWFIGVMACLTFMSYMTLKVILEYLTYPKVLIKEDLIYHKMSFPAVTVCSLNPISNHNVAETSLNKFLDLQLMMQNISTKGLDPSVRNDCYKKPLCKWSWFQEKCHCVENPCLTEFCLAENETHCNCEVSFCTSKTSKVEGCYAVEEFLVPFHKNIMCLCEGVSTRDSDMSHENIKELLDSIDNEGVKEVIRLVKQAKTYDLVDVEEALMPNATELYRYGVTFDSLVSACSFEGQHCHRENFTVLYHPNYGKCYMFNFVGNDPSDVEKPIEIDRYGSASGLQLLLRVTDHNVLDLLRREIGARVVIHDPHTLPFVSEYGVNVRPRDMTAVEVSLSKVQRLSKPWGNCEEDIKRMYNGDPYSILGCEKYCGYQHMTNHCNCTMRHYLRGSFLNASEPYYHFCNLTDDVQKNCVAQVTNDIEKTSKCDCRPPCSETVYSYTVTSSELNEKYYRTVKAIRTLNLDDKGVLQYMNSSDEKSMVGVKVYYNTFQVSSHKEVESYSWETLVANIGGNLGFFMGLTLITFLEIAEFIWDIIKTACSKTKPDNKIRKLPTT